MPKSYHSYTVQFKVSVVDWHNANGANLSKTSREFEIDRKRIREWIANYDTPFELPRTRKTKLPSNRPPPS